MSTNQPQLKLAQNCVKLSEIEFNVCLKAAYESRARVYRADWCKDDHEGRIQQCYRESSLIPKESSECKSRCSGTEY